METSPGAEAAQDATGVTAGATDEGGGDAGESKASDPSVEGPQGFVIGDVATAGDMSYTVTGVDTAASVGSSFLEEKAKGMYLIVSVEVTNNGNEAVMIDDSFFTLKNGDKSYDADSMASMTANSDDSGNSSFSWRTSTLMSPWRGTLSLMCRRTSQLHTTIESKHKQVSGGQKL